MSNIAKVFIVINFFLSVLYLGFAATLLAQKWDYRQMYLSSNYKHKQDLNEKDVELQEAKNRIAHFNEYLGEAKKSAKEFQEKYIQVQQENEALTRTNDAYKVEIAKISADINEIYKRIDQKDQRIAELELARDRQKEVAEEAIKAKEEAQDEQQRMEIQLSNLQGEISEKEKLLQRSEKELWEAKQVIRAVEQAGVNIPSLFKRSQPLDGQIVAVSNEVPIVMISLGSDNGVEKGYQFTVYRGSSFIGRVVVEEVYKDMSAARILKDMTVKAIQKSDKVTTRIGGGGSF